MHSDILSFPPSPDPMPPSPPNGDAPIYPSLHDGSTPILSPIQVDTAVSPDLFEGASVGEDIPMPIETPQISTSQHQEPVGLVPAQPSAPLWE